MLPADEEILSIQLVTNNKYARQVRSCAAGLTFVHRCRRSWRFLKEKKCQFKYKVSSRNIFIYTYPIHQFFVFSLAGLTSWYVSHHQSDEHRADGLVRGIYFGTPHRTHYMYIRVLRLFVRAS